MSQCIQNENIDTRQYIAFSPDGYAPVQEYMCRGSGNFQFPAGLAPINGEVNDTQDRHNPNNDYLPLHCISTGEIKLPKEQW